MVADGDKLRIAAFVRDDPKYPIPDDYVHETDIIIQVGDKRLTIRDRRELPHDFLAIGPGCETQHFDDPVTALRWIMEEVEAVYGKEK